MSDDAEMKRLITEADSPLELGRCSQLAYGVFNHPMSPIWAMDAQKKGLIEVREGKLSHAKSCVAAVIILTECGREFCGLPKLKSVEVAKKEKSKVRSLFD